MSIAWIIEKVRGEEKEGLENGGGGREGGGEGGGD